MLFSFLQFLINIVDGWPSLWVFIKHGQNKSYKLWRVGTFDRLWLMINYVIGKGLNAGIFERMFECCHVVENATQCPDIHWK